MRELRQVAVAAEAEQELKVEKGVTEFGNNLSQPYLIFMEILQRRRRSLPLMRFTWGGVFNLKLTLKLSPHHMENGSTEPKEYNK